MKDKLVELITVGFTKCTKPHECYAQLDLEALADYLIAHGVTVQTDVSDNNVGNKLEITAALKTAKIISYHLRKDFPFSANIIAAQIAHDLMAQGLLEVE